MNLQIPATTVPANSAVDILYDNQGGFPGTPMLLAPIGIIDPSWDGAVWAAWTEPAPGYGVTTSWTKFHIRICNVTATQLNLAGQEFTGVSAAR